jgi:hypothetical protein
MVEVKRCTDGGNVHGTEVQTGTYEVEVGPEMVMYGTVACTDCRVVLRLPVISRRSKPA